MTELIRGLWRKAIAVLSSAILLVAGLAAVQPTAAGAAHDSNGEIEIVTSGHHGTVEGTDFTRYGCRYSGEADELNYVRLSDGVAGPVGFDVSCSLILPTNPDDWNGSIVVEPLDVFAPFSPLGEVARQFLIGEDVIFGGKNKNPRNGYATVGYTATGPGDYVDQDQTRDDNFDGTPDDAAAVVEIFADFAAALRSGGDSDLVGEGTSYGPASNITAVGLSNQATAIRGAMRFGEVSGVEPFDAAMPMATGVTLTPDPNGFSAFSAAGVMDFGEQKALFLNTEGEVAANGTFDAFGFIPADSTADIRSEADGVHRFIYEIAGASHLSPVNQQDLINIGLMPPGSFDTSNRLEWRVVSRAVFTQMQEWVTTGQVPESSRLLDPPTDPTAQDPAYPGHPSVEFAQVSRDQSLNALGGIRLPDVELGVGTYRSIGSALIFADPTVEFFQWLAGGYTDLSCTPLDGTDRFKSHGHYIGQHTKLANQLVNDRFLLRGDAKEMKSAAIASDIGNCP